MRLEKFLQKHREKVLLLSDLGVVLLAYVIGFCFLSYEAIITNTGRLYDLLIILPAVLVIYTIMNIKFSVHGSLWKYFGIHEIATIVYVNIISAFVSSFVVLFVSAFYDTFDTSTRFTLFLSLFLSSLLSILGMFALRFVYRMYRERKLGNNLDGKRVLIVGAGDGGYLMLKDLLHTSSVNVVGFIDDQLSGKTIAGVHVLGRIDEIEKIVSEEEIQSIYLAIPSMDMKQQKELIARFSNMDVTVKVMQKVRHHNHQGNSGFKYPINDVSIEDLLGRGEISLDSSEISSYLKNEVVMVTGAAGSIGSELCRQILKFEPKKMLLVDINENELYMLEREFMRGDFQTEIRALIVSIRDKDSISTVMQNEKPKVVFHAAAHKHVPLMETRPQEAIKNNVIGTQNVIDAAIENGVSRFVLISTDKAVNPTNVMGATKRLTELILQSRAHNGVTRLGAVRFGNVLGSNGSVIPIFKEQIKNGGPVTITHKDIIRYFMTIPEAAQLVLQAGFYADQGEIFVLDMGEPVKIVDLAKKMITLSGYRPGHDIEIKEVGLREGEKMFEELNLGSETVDKTKHELIFETHSKQIDRQNLEAHVKELEYLAHTPIQPAELKQKVLDVIKLWD